MIYTSFFLRSENFSEKDNQEIKLLSIRYIAVGGEDGLHQLPKRRESEEKEKI